MRLCTNGTVINAMSSSTDSRTTVFSNPGKQDNSLERFSCNDTNMPMTFRLMIVSPLSCPNRSPAISAKLYSKLPCSLLPVVCIAPTYMATARSNDSCAWTLSCVVSQPRTILYNSCITAIQTLRTRAASVSILDDVLNSIKCSTMVLAYSSAGRPPKYPWSFPSSTPDRRKEYRNILYIGSCFMVLPESKLNDANETSRLMESL